MIINNINPEELLSSHGIEYKYHGKSIKTYCFYHDETEPSFSINRDDGYFHCFSCGKSGSIYNLYELVTGQRLQIDSKEYNNFKWNKNLNEEKRKIRTDNKELEIKIIGKLKPIIENKELRLWVYKYGIEQDQFIIDRNISYSTYTEMIASDLMLDTKNEYTKMCDRVTIPIYGLNGKIINYEGRTYKDAKPKVLYPSGGLKTVLYNWQFIDHTKPLVVVEGIKALWRVWNIYKNVVAVMGNIPTDEQFLLLNNYESELIFFLDNDYGGWGGGDLSKDKDRKGMIQYLDQFLTKEFKICYGDKWKDDPNDLSYTTIENKIKTATWYNEYLVNSVIKKKEVRGW